MSSTLHLDFVVSDDFLRIWNAPLFFRITTDYEEMSTFVVCRYLMQESITMAYPILKSPFFFASKPFDAKALFVKLGLRAERVKDMPNWETVAFAPQQALLFCLADEMLKGRFTLLSPSQDESITFLSNSDSERKFEAISLESCIITPDGHGSLQLRLSGIRMSSFDAESNQVADEESSGERRLSKAIIMHTNQDVTIQGFKTICKDDKSAFLTEANQRQLQLGYLQYLPNTKDKFRLYWTLATGLLRVDSTNVVQVTDGIHDQFVPIEILARSINSVKPNRALQGSMLLAVHSTLSTCSMLQSIDLPTNVTEAIPIEVAETTKKGISFRKGTQLRKKKIQQYVRDDSDSEGDDLFVDLVDDWPRSKKQKA